MKNRLLRIIHWITGKHRLSWGERQRLLDLDTREFFAGGACSNGSSPGSYHKIPPLTEKEKREIEKERNKIITCSCGHKKQ